MAAQNLLNTPLTGNITTGTRIATMRQVTINTVGNTIMEPFVEYYLTGSSPHTFKLPVSAVFGDKFTVISTNGSLNIVISVENTGTQQILFHPTTGPETGTTLQSGDVFAAVTMVCTISGLSFQVLNNNGPTFTMS